MMIPQDLYKVTIFEMYLDWKEFRLVIEDALNILRNYTIFDNCIGAWKGKILNSNVLRFIATTPEHKERWMKFYEVCKKKLEVSNYLTYEADFRLDKNMVTLP